MSDGLNEALLLIAFFAIIMGVFWQILTYLEKIKDEEDDFDDDDDWKNWRSIRGFIW